MNTENQYDGLSISFSLSRCRVVLALLKYVYQKGDQRQGEREGGKDFNISSGGSRQLWNPSQKSKDQHEIMTLGYICTPPYLYNR